MTTTSTCRPSCGTDSAVAVRIRRITTTRAGGVSAPPYDSFNLGDHVGDDPAAVAANRARLASAVGLPADHVVWMNQVHSAHVEFVDSPRDQSLDATDALVTRTPRLALAVVTADCVPVLIACTETGVVCAVHAGWRGIVAGVVPHAIGAMRAAHGVRPGGMVAAIGPCIGRDVYEVGPDVAAEFAKVVGDAFVLPAGGGRAKEHIDCFGAVRSQLVACGIPAESVDGEELCTVATPREFFSYRRDGARSGRMASVVVPRR